MAELAGGSTRSRDVADHRLSPDCFPGIGGAQAKFKGSRAATKSQKDSE